MYYNNNQRKTPGDRTWVGWLAGILLILWAVAHANGWLP